VTAERREVPPDAQGTRLDVYVSESMPSVSRALAARLAREEHILVNGNPAKPSHRLNAGDVVEAEIIHPAAISAAPEDIPLVIIYQDEDVAVIDKPPGLVVHPAPGHAGGTLANALAAQFPRSAGVGGRERPGIVHRLDKDTSGLMVAALSPEAHRSLQAQIAARRAGRRYLALVPGRMRPEQGTIDAPIGRDPRNRKRMAVRGVAPRDARTSYQTIELLPGYSLLEASLHTGRTHQIRVHLAAAGHPVAGDRTYQGPPLPGLERQFLHAYRLSFAHPKTGQDLQFESALPPDLRRVLDDTRHA